MAIQIMYINNRVRLRTHLGEPLESLLEKVSQKLAVLCMEKWPTSTIKMRTTNNRQTQFYIIERGCSMFHLREPATATFVPLPTP